VDVDVIPEVRDDLSETEAAEGSEVKNGLLLHKDEAGRAGKLRRRIWFVSLASTLEGVVSEPHVEGGAGGHGKPDDFRVSILCWV
jgi:hypothetical protein